MTSAASRVSTPDKIPSILGKAPITRAFYDKTDISELWEKLVKRISENAADAAAFMDASMVIHCAGKEQEAVAAQKAALDSSRQYRITNGTGTGLNVLVFVTAGDFMANTPIEFLLEYSNANILLYYVDADTKDLSDVPDHDVAFVGVAESPEAVAVMDNLERLLRGWSGPIVNNAPRSIMAMSRDGVAETFRNGGSVVVAATVRASRETLEALAAERISLDSVLPGHRFPLILRPVGTHAGEGMEKIDRPSDIAAFLARQPETLFYVMPFIDYSGSDGMFRKYRIAFIDGKAYASHMAISQHWMIHYLNAGMATHEERRAEEAVWMENFDTFAARHAGAFQTLCDRFGLDYFAVDCAELSDGRLLLFEASIAMIVHSMDSETLYPYKKQPMMKLFSAFETSLLRTSLAAIAA